MPPPRTVASGTSPEQWFRELPPMTKILFSTCLLLAACTTMSILGENSLVLYWPLIKSRFEIWRLFTPFLYAGKFGMPFCMHLYMLYTNSLSYERSAFNTGAGGTSADMLFMTLFGMLSFTLIDIFVMGPMMILSSQLLYMIVYMRSRRDPHSIQKIFTIPIPMFYLPWVYVGIAVLMGNSPYPALIGIFVGHVFYFFTQEFPKISGFDLLLTPRFCCDLMSYMGAPASNGGGIAGGFGGSPASSSSSSGNSGGFRWGRGRTLGSR